MHIDGDSVPRITLRDGTTIPQFGFGTLAVQPDRESSEANAETTGLIVSQALGPDTGTSILPSHMAPSGVSAGRSRRPGSIGTSSTSPAGSPTTTMPPMMCDGPWTRHLRTSG